MITQCSRPKPFIFRLHCERRVSTVSAWKCENYGSSISFLPLIPLWRMCRQNWRKAIGIFLPETKLLLHSVTTHNIRPSWELIPMSTGEKLWCLERASDWCVYCVLKCGCSISWRPTSVQQRSPGNGRAALESFLLEAALRLGDSRKPARSWATTIA